MPDFRIRLLYAATLLLVAGACATAAPGGAVVPPSVPPEDLATTGAILVANQQSANATLVDLATGSATNIHVGAGPHEAVISPDGRWGVVTVYGAGTPGNQLAVIDMSRRALARMVDLDAYRRPHDIAFLPGSNEQVVVTSEANQRVISVNISTGAVHAEAETRAEGSHMLAIAPDGRTVFTTNVPAGNVSQMDIVAQEFVRHIPVAPAVEGVALTPDGSELWVGSNQAGTVTVIDVATGTIAATISNLGIPYRIAISHDGRLAAVPDPQGNQLHVVDVRLRRSLGTVGGLGSPRGVSIAPDGRTAFVTLGHENAVAVVDLVERTVRARHNVGAVPDGIGWGRSPGS